VSSAARALHEVRIMGGQWRRSRLPVADRPGLRPTPSRVRETLFNWLGQQLPGWQCLDAFGGSGALGFEAASRGAARVLIVERDAALAASLRASRERLHAQAVQVLCADGLAVLRAQPVASLDLVFLDPPFGAGLLAAALEASVQALRPGGFVHAESPKPLTDLPAGLVAWRQGRAGQVHHALLRRSEEEEPAAQGGYTAARMAGE
jgi:16S rRNA (guanine(966)-N(2))-methyltransferase RsmD